MRGACRNAAGRKARHAAINGTLSAYPERTLGGYYLDFDVDREAVAQVYTPLRQTRQAASAIEGRIPGKPDARTYLIGISSRGTSADQ